MSIINWNYISDVLTAGYKG